MQCKSCGAPLPDGTKFCTNCGCAVSDTVQQQSNPYIQPNSGFTNQQINPQGQPFVNQQFNPQGQPFPNQQFNPQGQPFMNQQFNQPQPPFMTKSAFYKHPNLKKCRGNIIGSAVALYICSGLTLLVALFTANYLSILDAMIMVGLALGIQLGKSRVCSIIICGYAIINVIYMCISTGKPGGYLILIAAIYAIIATFQFQSAWNNYQKTGMLP